MSIISKIDRPAAEARYARLRQTIPRIFTSNYDISNICNLRCEGCLFFSGADENDLNAVDDIKQWQDFFSQEAARRINFAYIAGAEPSLTPDRIQACHDHIPMGVIVTNGTKRIASNIRYRIHVSLWGNEARSELYRGANVNNRAFRNYANDPRAIFVMTLSNININEIPEVVQTCADHNVQLHFSLFSPTTDYNIRQSNTQTDASDYFRFSTKSVDMRFDKAGLKRARLAMLDAAKNYPETVKLSTGYINWVTQADDLYTLDERGIATDCGNRLTRWHRHFNPDMSRNSGKCCTPNLDCTDCRAYAMGLATYLTRQKSRKSSPEAFCAWVDALEYWANAFMPLR